MRKIKLLDEFKEFAMRGNFIDMAVGVIIGGASGKIVTSLVSDMVMPLISAITGRVNLANLAVTVALTDKDGAPISINYGMFLQNILDFLIIALCVFFMIKLINMFRRKQEKKAEAEAAPSKQEVLLAEIRDILKNGKE